MQNIGHIWRARPGMADEYAKQHRVIWPELTVLLRDAGVSSYTIYASGEMLVSHMAVADYEQFLRDYSASRVAERWERLMSSLIEYPDADLLTGWPKPLKEIWSL